MSVSRIHILLSVFVSIFMATTLNAQTIQKPDFAYPKKESEQSNAALASALKQNNDPATLKALLNYYLAETRISPDRASVGLKKIDSISVSTSSPVLKAMLNILEADIYSSIYSSSRWKYDSRNLPIQPIPEDYQQWSGDQFRHKINTLIDSALSNSTVLKTTPIKAYATVLSLGSAVSIKNETQTYYSTIYDFIATKSIDLLKSTGRINNILSWGLLTRHDLYLCQPFNKFDPIAGKILDLYADLLRFHPSPSAPFILNEMDRLDFITDHIWYGGDIQAESPSDRKNQLLIDLYEECKTSEYSGDILLNIKYNNITCKRWLHSAIKHNLSTFHAFRRNNNLRNALSEIEMKCIELNHAFTTAPNVPVTFDISVTNVKTGKLYIYNVSSTPIANQSYICTGLPSLSPVAILPIKANSNCEIPFSEKVKIDYKFAAPGQYIAIATIDGAPRKTREGYRKIYVTNYAIASSNFDKAKVWALNATDGSPVGDAKISIVKDNARSGSTPTLIGSTSSNGDIECKQNGYILMSKDSDRFAAPLWLYQNNNSRMATDWRKSASGYPALPIYHPGDSVEWMAICYEYKEKQKRPLINTEISAILRDSKYQSLDTVKLTTDMYGRVAGCFAIPKETLSGNFCISVDDYSDPVHFIVSDYKLPTFKVILDPVENNYPKDGDATLRGRVQTYAGFPIADAKITVKLSALQPLHWWWNQSSPICFQTLETTSDESGDINLTIPKSTLSLTPIPGGIFNVEVTAMSPSGESQLASTNFSIGLRYAIKASVPANVDISTPVSAIKAEVVDYRDSIVKTPIDLTVIRDSVEVFKTSLRPGQANIDLSSLKSGRYKLIFTLADSSLATQNTQETILYRPTDNSTPEPGNLLWYPATTVNIDPKTGDGDWLYAVDCPTNLLVTLYTTDSIISQDWIPAIEGMHHLKLHLPDGIDEAKATIALTGKYRNASATVTVKRKKLEQSIKFVTETFRDRTIPGSEETWTFRVIDQSSEGKQSAVVMDMYNTALDALAKTNWSFHPASSAISGHTFRWNQNDLSSLEYQSVYYRAGKLLPQNNIVTPKFDTYGLPIYSPYLYATNGIRIRGTRSNLNVVREHKEEVVVDEIANMSDSAPLALSTAKMAKMDAGAGAITMDSEEEASDAASEDGSQSVETEQPFMFRDREVPLAFFKPMLQTDSNGQLSLSFTVPNANTTWGLRAIAFTDSLLSTSFSSEIIASKPVMVQPNLPRFVRAGDKIRIDAAIMNGSDESLSIRTLIELFNPADGTTISTYTRLDTIAANNSTTVGTDLIVPSDVPFIGYRIKSASDRFSDGEQTLLPILPAVTPVIDTYPFYIAPDQNKFSMQLPIVPKNAKVTLQYCDNPTWYVVTALPGLLDIEASTANEAGASIFSAAVASGLLRDNQAIASAINEWNSSNKSDGMLTSMLERNEDLKQVLLAATPWMLDAKNDTERMNRLALLFDEKTIKNAISANIATLRKLQRNGGGWAWYSSSKEASQWATENLLLIFGRLLDLGFMPDSKELNRMIVSALKWTDSEVKRDFDKYPEGDYSSYVYMRGFYKSMSGAPTPDPRIINKTVQRIISEWKTASVFQKAVYARILAWNSYPSVARELLASLREYSETTPEKGMWWPSLDNLNLWSMGKVGTTALILDAFSAIEPNCTDIDRIRQWLILQKETHDWGSSVTTTSAIASILTSSHKWIAEAGEAKISIDGKNVSTTKIERLTGSFRTTVDLKSGKEPQLKINRNRPVNSPAWGSMFYLYTDSMTSVKASACPELSITKNLTTGNGTPTDQTSYATDSLSVGQRIHVALTLKVDMDMDYVTIVDERPACFEPVDQLPTPIFAEGIYFYRENRNSSTRFFIDHLPKGTYQLDYDVWVNNAGQFSSGIATIQSQYAPRFSAHTSGTRLSVKSLPE